MFHISLLAIDDRFTMRIVLFWSFKRAVRFQGKRAAFPLSGLLTVSTHPLSREQK
jgi:hypothetical protein